MRVLLCGWGQPGYDAVGYLVQRGHDVMVATHQRPDPQQYRIPVPSLIDAAAEHGLECVIGGPKTKVYPVAKDFEPDAIVSVLYRRILPPCILELVQDDCRFNVHPGLLPDHKGFSANVHAILAGDSHSGVTVHTMIEQVDQGYAFKLGKFPLTAEATGLSALEDSQKMVTKCFNEVWEKFEAAWQARGHEDRGTDPKNWLLPSHYLPMDAGAYHDKGMPNDGVINPRWDPKYIGRFIRALYCPPWNPACVLMQSKENDADPNLSTRHEAPVERVYVNTMSEYKEIMSDPVLSARVIIPDEPLEANKFYH